MNILLSYHYYGRQPLGRFFATHFGTDRSLWPGIVLDSGAVSSAALGVDIDIKAYARWAKDGLQYDNVRWAANLDVIGDWKRSARNHSILQDLGLDAMPVFHNGGNPFTELEALCSRHEYVGIGGMVRPGTKIESAYPWLVRVHRIAQEHGTKLHGFGMTRWKNILRFPWHSVDSSSWGSGHRNGQLYVWDGGRLRRFGYDKIARYEHLIRDHGINPDMLREPNYHYRYAAAVTGVAWARAEKALARSRPGFRLYLADSNDRALRAAFINWNRTEGLIPA